MKRIIASFALFTAVTIALASRASAQDQPFQANVPFAFTVGNQQLPLGNYRIKTFGSRQVQIENMSQDILASALANPSNMSKNENQKLVFDKVGDQYFLKKIVSTSTAVEFPKSESEKRALTLQHQSIDDYAKNVTMQ